MKKAGFIITAAFLGILWLWIVYYGLIEGHMISFILCAIILAPVTFRVVYGYLLSASEEKDARKTSDEHTHYDAPESVQFCPNCGSRNENGGKFCVSCGARLRD